MLLSSSSKLVNMAWRPLCNLAEPSWVRGTIESRLATDQPQMHFPATQPHWGESSTKPLMCFLSFSHFKRNQPHLSLWCCYNYPFLFLSWSAVHQGSYIFTYRAPSVHCIHKKTIRAYMNGRRQCGHLPVVKFNLFMWVHDFTICEDICLHWGAAVLQCCHCHRNMNYITSWFSNSKELHLGGILQKVLNRTIFVLFILSNLQVWN